METDSLSCFLLLKLHIIMRGFIILSGSIAFHEKKLNQMIYILLAAYWLPENNFFMDF